MSKLEVLIHKALEKFIEEEPEPSVVKDLEAMFMKIRRMGKKDIVPTHRLLNTLRERYSENDRVEGLTRYLLLSLEDRALLLLDKHINDKDIGMYERQFMLAFGETA